jgi:hypothetical protein
MRRLSPLLGLVSVGLVFAGPKVRVDYEHGHNFSCYKTYRWVRTQPLQPTDASFPNQLMDKRIVGFVEEALAARHLVRVEGDADLLINYQVNVTEEPQYTTFTTSTGPGWGWGGWGWGGWGWGPGWGGVDSAVSVTTTEPVAVGSLVINVVDARQKQLVFQGVSTATVSSKARTNTERLQKGINEIFEKFPPVN